MRWCDVTRHGLLLRLRRRADPVKSNPARTGGYSIRTPLAMVVGPHVPLPLAHQCDRIT